MAAGAGTTSQDGRILRSLVVRTGVGLQLLLGLCYCAALVLYVVARLTIGGHEAVTGGNHDPKDLASGILGLVVLVLHAFAVIGAIVGPGPAVVLGPLILVGVLLLAPAARRDALTRPPVVLALGVFAVAVILSGVDAVPDVRHWLLD
ncbi:hypothetical protein [Micromonospora cathayae]|uniref:Tripartite tricarboxylate transporter TctB family protein n=1 Tax=Micromonospora cathayae TaxID=3028804 RepID=A0ABY7ZI26_9ACTN|nr:hypothetical protein [Micromonospora sp. HUAS 3]WDZ82642.1 hypothetical protein PVK37_19435 [Micromonospora sp. HUAS 3]